MVTSVQLIELINTTLKINLDPAGAPLDESFAGLGIDSLDFFNVLVELENLTGKKISDAEAQKLTNINAVVDFCNQV